jgi:hypothetical protein
MIKTFKVIFFDKDKKKDVAYVSALTAADAIEQVKKTFRVYLINGWKEMKGKYDKFTKRTAAEDGKVSIPYQVAFGSTSPKKASE